MATGAHLRQKLGPIKARLEQSLQETKQFLVQPTQVDEEKYLEQVQKLKAALQKRLDSFRDADVQLVEIAKTNQDEAQRLAAQAEDYITVPLEADETIVFLQLKEEQIATAKSERKKKLLEEKQEALEI